MRFRNIPERAAFLVLSASALCNCANAMGSDPKIPSPFAVSPIAVSNDDLNNGYQLGLRNGELIVKRLKQRTVDEQGCAAIDRLQDALVKVTRSIKPPFDSNDDVISGFYQGYLDSVRTAIRSVRASCEVLSFDDGSFAGYLYGNLACQILTIDAQAIALVETALQPLYEGWSGGSGTVVQSCKAIVQATITVCAGDIPSVQADVVANASCSDTGL